MRFIVSVWTLILTPLTVFTFLVFSHDRITKELSPEALDFALLLSAWVIGIVSAATIHRLYRGTEKALQRAARDQTIVELAGGVAHEMNQPLTVLISSGELLCNHGQTPDEMRAVAVRMIDASQRMADIVEKLQRATHYQAKQYVGDVQIVDLDRAV